MMEFTELFCDEAHSAQEHTRVATIHVAQIIQTRPERTRNRVTYVHIRVYTAC